MKSYRSISLRGITQANRVHQADADGQLWRVVRNFYISRSDLAVTMRGDFERFRDDIFSLADLWTSGTNPVEWLNTIITAPTLNGHVFISTLCPSALSDGVGVITSDIIVDGTVSSSGTKITKTGGDSWLHYAWPHCFIKFGSDTQVYRVASVESADVLYTETAPATLTNSSYVLYQTHDSDRALSPMHLARFTDVLIYQAVDPLGGDSSSICGPFWTQADWTGEETIGSRALKVFSFGVTGTKFPSTIRRVAYFNNLWTVFGVSTAIATSPDAASWAALRSVESGSPDFKGMAYSGSTYLIGGGSDVSYSPDGGTTWTALSFGATDVQDVAYGGAVWRVQTASKSYQTAALSPTATWSEVATPGIRTLSAGTTWLVLPGDQSGVWYGTTKYAFSSAVLSWFSLRNHLNSVAFHPQGPYRWVFVGTNGGIVAVKNFITDPAPGGSVTDLLKLSCSGGTTPIVDIASQVMTLTVTGSTAVYDLTVASNQYISQIIRHIDGMSLGGGTLSASYPTDGTSIHRLTLSNNGTTPTVSILDGVMTITVNGTSETYDLADTDYDTLRKLIRILDGSVIDGGTTTAAFTTLGTTSPRMTLSSTGTTPLAALNTSAKTLTVTVNSTPVTYDLTIPAYDSVYKLSKVLDQKSLGNGVITASTPDDVVTSLLTVSAVGTAPLTIGVASGVLTVSINSTPATYNLTLTDYNTIRKLGYALNMKSLGSGTITAAINGTTTTTSMFKVYWSGITSLTINNYTLTIVPNSGTTLVMDLTDPHYRYIYRLIEEFGGGKTVGTGTVSFQYLPGVELYYMLDCSLLDEVTLVASLGILYYSVHSVDNILSSALDNLSTVSMAGSGVTLTSTTSSGATHASVDLDGFRSSSIAADTILYETVYPDEDTASIGLDNLGATSIATAVTLDETTNTGAYRLSKDLDNVTALDISTEKTLVATFQESIWISCNGTTPKVTILDGNLTVFVSTSSAVLDISTITIAAVVMWLNGKHVGDGDIVAIADPRSYTATRVALCLTECNAKSISSLTRFTLTNATKFFLNSHTGTNLNDIVYASTAGKFVAVGDAGAIVYSSDGNTWMNGNTVSSTANLVSVTTDGSNFMAVGSDGATQVVWYSHDGITWTDAKVGISNLHGIASSLNEVVAVSNLTKALRSTTGDNWTEKALAENVQFNDVAYGTAFVAVGDSGKIEVSQNGETWAAKTSGVTGALNGVCYGVAAKYVAVGTVCVTTASDNFESDTIGAAPSGWTQTENSDSSVWTVQSSGGSQVLRFTWVPLYSRTIRWDTPWTSANQRLQMRIKWNGQNFQTWLRVSAFSSGAPSTGYFIGVNKAGTLATILSSVSGTVTGLISKAVSLAVGTSYYFEFDCTGTHIAMRHWASGSPKPVPWDMEVTDSSCATAGYVCLRYSASDSPDSTQDHDDLLLNSQAVVLTSADGETWTSRMSGITTDLQAVAYSPTLTLYVAVGVYGRLASSADGVTWTNHSSSVPTTPVDFQAKTFYGVTWDGTKFVVVGQGGAIMTSTDGTTTWTEVAAGITADLHTVVSDGTTNLVVAGVGGVVYTSTDSGTTWTALTTNVTDTLYRGTYFAKTKMFYVCGGAVILAIGFTSYGASLLWTPLSTSYRSVAYAVVDGQTVLINTMEWEESRWTHHARRIRWSAPLAFQDFDGEGSGYADITGFGALLDARVSGHNVIIAEEAAISALTPSGDSLNPWDYRVVRANIWSVSNLCAVDDVVYFIGPDGTLYKATPISVDQIDCELDVSEFSDAPSTTPVQLVFDRERQMLEIYRPDASASPHLAYTLNMETWAVTSYELPTLITIATGAQDDYARGIVQVVTAAPPVAISPSRYTP